MLFDNTVHKIVDDRFSIQILKTPNQQNHFHENFRKIDFTEKTWVRKKVKKH